MKLRFASTTVGLAVGVTAAAVLACAAGAYLFSRQHMASLLQNARNTALAESDLIRVALEHEMLANDRTLIARMIEGVTWLIDEESVRSVETFLAAHPIPEGARIIAQHLERQCTNRAVAVRDAADLAKHLART